MKITFSGKPHDPQELDKLLDRLIDDMPRYNTWNGWHIWETEPLCAYCLFPLNVHEINMVDGTIGSNEYETQNATCPVCKRKYHYNDCIGWLYSGKSQ